MCLYECVCVCVCVCVCGGGVMYIFGRLRFTPVPHTKPRSAVTGIIPTRRFRTGIPICNSPLGNWYPLEGGHFPFRHTLGYSLESTYLQFTFMPTFIYN